MYQHSLFISDLHLSPQHTDITRHLFTFLQQQARDAQCLYILGDLFDYWIGDDDSAPWLSSIKQQFKELTRYGTTVYIMPGNRDFLLGTSFAASTNCHLLADPTVIQLYEKTILLKHGDDLCTDDLSHQKFRSYTHNTRLQHYFLALPLCTRHWIAKRIRHASRQRQYKQPIADINPQAITQALQQHKADLLIHGHTHKPLITEHRCVLGTWESQPYVLRFDQNGAQQIGIN